MNLKSTWLRTAFWCVWTAVIPLYGGAQIKTDPIQEATLEKVVAYALENQPALRQAEVNQTIVEKTIKGRLADWYPQINFTYNYQRFIELQSSVIGGQVIRFGVDNTSSAQLNATQNLFNRDVLLASNTASTVRMQAEQSTNKTKIATIVDVTKAYYDVLATQQQIEVSQESVVRLERSLKDARSRYESGVSDKTDYQRATIALSNTKTALKSNQELLEYKKKNLKTLMGYPLEQDLPIVSEVSEMEQRIVLDTAGGVSPDNHIDYKILKTQQHLQDANVKYSQWAFVPTVNLFGTYTFNYQNDQLSELYSTRYPYSYVGLSVGLPIFQGGKRVAKVQEQKWTRTQLDVQMEDLTKRLNTEYERTLAAYKSNLFNYQAQKENVELAQEVYDVINLQYKSGVKTYLDVTIAETDLRTTRINYFNALYQVLASKIDVERALGTIN